jgi:tryptophan 2,3-dioxygenase
MANRDLIAQQGLIYQSRYYDPSLSFEQPFARAQSMVDNILARKKREKALVESKVANYIDNMAEPLNVAKIPPKYRDSVNKFLIQKRNEYAQAARVASRYSPTSTAYMESVSKMNSISSSFEQLNNQFEIFKKMKDEDLPDFTGRLVSDGNKNSDLNILTDVLTDKYDISITDNGNISFYTGEISENGENIIIQKELNDLPKYFNKDFKTANKIVELNKKIYNGGNKLDAASRDFYKLQLKSMLSEGGRETVVSLATDDFIIDGGLGLDPALLEDESRHDELTNIVVEQYLNMFDKTASAGFKSAEYKRKKQLLGDGGDDFKLTPSVQQEITLGQGRAGKARESALAFVNAAKAGNWEQVAKKYINFVKANSSGTAREMITRGEHFKLYANQFEGVSRDKLIKDYREIYPKDQYMFILNKGQVDPEFDDSWSGFNPFSNLSDPNAVYQELLYDIGFSDNAVGYFVSGGGTSSDEGVLNVQ